LVDFFYTTLTPNISNATLQIMAADYYMLRQLTNEPVANSTFSLDPPTMLSNLIYFHHVRTHPCPVV